MVGVQLSVDGYLSSGFLYTLQWRRNMSVAFHTPDNRQRTTDYCGL